MITAQHMIGQIVGESSATLSSPPLLQLLLLSLHLSFKSAFEYTSNACLGCAAEKKKVAAPEVRQQEDCKRCRSTSTPRAKPVVPFGPPLDSGLPILLQPFVHGERLRLSLSESRVPYVADALLPLFLLLFLHQNKRCDTGM